MLPIMIRGKLLQSGDPVFIRDDSARDFRIANVEDGNEEEVVISFPVPRIKRRAASVRVAPNDVILAQEIEDKPIANGRLVGDLLVRSTAPDRVVVLQVQEDAPGGQATTTVRRVYLEDGTWTPVGDVEVVQSRDAFPPILFATIARWRFTQAVDPLFDILADDIGEAWSFKGRATLEVGGVHVPVTVNVSLEDDRKTIALSANYAIACLVGNLDPAFIKDERLYSESGEWLAHVAINGVSLAFDAESGYRASIEVITGVFEITHEDAEVVATREVYIGAPIEAWSDPLYVREPPLPALGPQYISIPSCIRFNIFGRPAIIYRPPLHFATEGSEHRAVVYLGEPLSDERRAVLSTFLGYVTGGRSRNVLTETFAIDRKRRTIYHDRGLPTERRCPPIPTDRATPYATLITSQFPQLLEAFTRWDLADTKSFSAIFHHYAEGVDSSYPVTRILRLAVAFEAFVNLVTQDTKENENIVVHDSYVPLRDHLLAALAEYAEGDRALFTAYVEGRYRTKILNANIASNTQRARRFWEIVPVVRSPEDNELLRRLRNESVHLGFVGDDLSFEGLRKNAIDAERLSDLFNRCVLVYAGYTGPMLSARGAWLQPLSGEPFATPELPRGPTLEVRFETPAPALDAAEAAAAESLQRMQCGKVEGQK